LEYTVRFIPSEYRLVKPQGEFTVPKERETKRGDQVLISSYQ
jgi:hypothetical protein